MDWALRIGSFSIGILDMCVLAIVLIVSIGCTVAGFSRSAAKSLGWILCYPIALYLTSLIARIFNENSNIGIFFSTMFAFAVVSVVIFALCNLLGSFLGNILSGIGLEVVDSVLGFLWGALVSLVVSGILIYMISVQTLFNADGFLGISHAYRLLSPLFPSTKDMLMGVVDAIV